MRIQVNMPAEYHQLLEIKASNRPYIMNFQAFMKAVIEFGDRQDLSLYALFGYIEHELAPDTPIQLDESAKGGKPVKFEYRENDPEVLDFYDEAPIRHSQTTEMFMRLMMRLSAKYGNSITEMIYLITTLGDAPVTSPSEPQPQEEVKPKVKIKHTAPARKPEPEVEPDPEPEVEPEVAEPEEPEEEDEATRKLREMNEKAEAMRKEMAKLTEQQEAAKAAAAARKGKKQPVEDTEEDNTGKQVATNPMLGDFMDFD